MNLVSGRCVELTRKKYRELLGLRGGFNSSKWQVFGELRNLTDRTYVSALSVRNAADDDAAILDAGAPRAAYLGVRTQL